MYIKRHLEETISKLSKNYSVIMVCGQRQVGKSTLLYHLKEEERSYISWTPGFVHIYAGGSMPKC